MDNTQEARCLVEYQICISDVDSGRWSIYDDFPLSEAIMQATDLRNNRPSTLAVRIRLFEDVPAPNALKPAGVILWFWEAMRVDQYRAYSETFSKGQDTGRD